MPSPATVAAIRFGNGFGSSDSSFATPEAILAQLDQIDTPVFPTEGNQGRRQRIIGIYQNLRDISQKAMMPADGNGARRDISQDVRSVFLADSKRRLFQGVASKHGFQERLAVFWSNLFSVSAAKSMPMRLWAPLYEAECIRPHMTGKFSDLLTAAAIHPAMLIYLDQVASLGPDSLASRRNGKGLNENLARELLELHSLGAGSGYTQTDVRATAMLLTGLGIDNRSAQAVFRSGLAEPGMQKILGKTYGSMPRKSADQLELLDDLGRDSRTARHICGKLAAHFLADQPPAGVVASMEDAWRASDGNLKAVYAAMLHAKESWSLPFAKARQPFDFVVATLRAVNAANDPALRADFLKQDDSRETQMRERAALRSDDSSAVPVASLALDSLEKMGQSSWMPLSPAGFDEAFSSWITAGQLSARIAWARLLAGRMSGQIDLRALLSRADWISAASARLILQAPNGAAAMAMFFASPDFNRR